MRGLLLSVLAALGMTLAFGGTAAAGSPSGARGFSLLEGSSPLNPASMPIGGDPAPNAAGDVTCSEVAPPSVPRDLIVPSGVRCIAPDGTTIGRDVIVEPGGALGTGGITVGHDVIGNDPEAIEIGDFARGSGRSFIGHDVIVTGATSPLFLQEVCNATVKHDIIWENDAPLAGLSIGDQNFFCFTGTDYVGHNGVIRNNQGEINDVSDNNPANGGGGFGHDLIVENNTNTIVASNAIGHNCIQQNNHPYTNNEGPNTAGHSVGSCNTPNP